MALIKCPNCGKEISDKATNCVACGYDLSETDRENDLGIICPECGTPLDTNLEVCPNCGCPINKEETFAEEPVFKEQEKPKKKRKIGLIIFLVILVAIGFFAKTVIDKNQYDSNSREAAALMAQGAALSEEICGQIHDVWYNCVFRVKDKETNKFTRKNSGKGEFYSDFNDAIGKLYDDEDFIKKCQELGTNMKDVASIMQKLTNPPNGYELRNDSLNDMYDIYTDFTAFAINSSGYTLIDYTDEFNDLDREAASELENLVLYFD